MGGRRLGSAYVCPSSLTNFVISPLHDKTREDAYWCILTRLDSFKVSLDADTWEIRSDQTGIESFAGAFERIRRFVGNRVHAKDKIEESVPGQTELNAEQDAELELATEENQVAEDALDALNPRRGDINVI